MTRLLSAIAFVLFCFIAAMPSVTFAKLRGKSLDFHHRRLGKIELTVNAFDSTIVSISSFQAFFFLL
jgi:hypothetical protein